MKRPSMWTTVTTGSCCWLGQARPARWTQAPKCQAGQEQGGGKYASCRQKAEAKAITTGDPADYTKCDEKFLAKWQRLEEQARRVLPGRNCGPEHAGGLHHRPL